MTDIILDIDDTPITLDNFFVGHHYANYKHLYDDDKESVLIEELAYPTLEKINAIEAKLEVTFPDTLIQLYLKQNGGSVGGLITPKVENPREDVEEDWIHPFSGYDDMYTLEHIRTVFESVSDYADYSEDLDMYPQNSKRLIILAQWYRETLFLDYRNATEPAVGFVDFDQFENLQTDEWETGAFWWKDFDTFFSRLMRGEYS